MARLYALNGPGFVDDTLKHLELKLNRCSVVVCCDDIRLGDRKMPRRIRYDLSGEIIAVPLKLGEPIFLGSRVQVAKE